MTAFYSEFDPKAAAWLRELIKRGLIADGVVDERDLWDVTPDDLRGFDQVHLCAGIGVWSYALRRAGWPDDRPVWTGSFPCQPFSAAGKGEGFADERHLWPAGQWLIEQCRPAVVFGEQVASKDAEPWLDLVQADLEALGYAVGAVPFPSAGIGAPHIRDRLYWVADDSLERRQQPSQPHGEPVKPALEAPRWLDVARRRDDDRMADALVLGRQCDERKDAAVFGRAQPIVPDRVPSDGPAGPVNGLWRDADWLLCRDGKWRPVEPDTFPLAHGAPARVGRLRGYGNAINAEAAVAWIEAYLDTRTIEADRRGLRLNDVSVLPHDVFL